jgi:hypothetical protein
MTTPKTPQEPPRAIVVNEPSPDALRRAYRFLRWPAEAEVAFAILEREEEAA